MSMGRILPYLVPLVGLVALFYAYTKARWIDRQDPGDETMRGIAANIAEGAAAFLRREYRVLAVFVAVVAVLLAVGYSFDSKTSSWIALSFVVGAGCSALAGYFGMRVATKANVRTANAARTSLGDALTVAFSGGAGDGPVRRGAGRAGPGAAVPDFRRRLGRPRRHAGGLARRDQDGALDAQRLLAGRQQHRPVRPRRRRHLHQGRRRRGRPGRQGLRRHPRGRPAQPRGHRRQRGRQRRRRRRHGRGFVRELRRLDPGHDAAGRLVRRILRRPG